MQIVVLANDQQKKEILSKKINNDIVITFYENISALDNYENADAYFILNHEFKKNELEKFTNAPVIIGSVTHTLQELNFGENVSRINQWTTFLKREKWEIATHNERNIKNIFDQVGWEVCFVKDEPGMVSARIISMIINEAYFALGDKVSTKNEIDIAMKLGTNYPYGPFEWSEKIGLDKIYYLLKELSKDDKRYTIATEMELAFKAYK